MKETFREKLAKLFRIPIEEIPESVNHIEALKMKPSKRHLARYTKSVIAIEELSNDPDKDVRHGVAYNPNCPAEILEKLSNDSDWLLRSSVAGNPNCPVEVLEKLSNDFNGNVRYSVTKNPNYSRLKIVLYAIVK